MMAMTDQERRTAEFVETHQELFIELGGTLIVLGLIAAAVALMTNLVTIPNLAGLALVAGSIRLIFASCTRGYIGSLYLAWPGAMYLIVSVVAFAQPSPLEPSLIFAALLVGVGLARLIASNLYPIPFGNPFTLSGVFGIFLGLFVGIAWPAAGAWFIAVSIGFDLIAEGVSWLALLIRHRTHAPSQQMR
jgi:uncharacterized membrane protein HdeD (DUF308 family)